MPFNTCPKGHNLPRRTAWANCTPLHCADDVKALDDVPGSTDDGSVGDQLNKASREAISTVAKKRIQRNSRETLVSVPEFHSAAEAEDWVNAKKVELTPYAMAEQEFRLKFGNDEQRDSASRYILDATGHGKRESGMGTGATIIIMGAGAELRPWVATKVVEAPHQLPPTAGEASVRIGPPLPAYASIEATTVDVFPNSGNDEED